MYSFGRVMFHVLTLVIPWNGIADIVVIQRILSGEDISNPATPDMTTARWNEIARCWSPGVSARPSATMVMDFLGGELAALTDDDIFVDGVGESHSNAISSHGRQPWRNLLISLFIIALVTVTTFRHHMNCASEQDLRTTLQMSNPPQPAHFDNVTHSKFQVVRNGSVQRTSTAIANTVMLSGSQDLGYPLIFHHARMAPTS